MLGKTNVKVKPNKKVNYIEYIESTETQYIDTGICPYKTKTEIIFQLTKKSSATGYAIASWNSGENRYYPVAYRITDDKFVTSNRTNTYTVIGNYDTNVHTVVYNDENNKVYFDGVEKATVSDLTTQGTNSIFLFAMHNSSNSAQDFFVGRIMAVKITDKETGKLIRDFRPAIDGAGVYCLYDKVEKRYYYNQGAGEFIGEGWEPTQLEYIESTGTQYIDTGFVPTANSKFELDIQYTSVPTGNASNNSYRNGIGGATTYSRFICGYNNTGFYYGIGGLNIDNTYGDTNRHVFTVDLKNMQYGYDNNLETASTTYSNPNQVKYTLFARNNGNNYSPQFDSYSKEKFYGCKLYDNDTLVHDFRPALDENGVACLYDKVSKTCFYNAGTGSFLGGASV